MLRSTLAALAAAAGIFLAATPTVFAQDEATETPEGAEVTVQGSYADVNGLHMYYEIHGSGEPLVVLHGAYMTIEWMGDLIPELAKSRQVIAVELQGHGHTADIDRPLTYEAMADDVAALLDELGIEKADMFGYSMGGGVAMQVAIRHPERVDKLISMSMPYNSNGYYPGMMEFFETITPEMFAGSPMETEFQRFNPDNPDGFATLVTKLATLDTTVQDWSPETMQAITAPTLLIFGDSDVITLAHAVEMFGLRGGNVNGDIVGLPESQLAIVPGTSHTSVISRVNILVPTITEFLDDTVPPSFMSPQ